MGSVGVTPIHIGNCLPVSGGFIGLTPLNPLFNTTLQAYGVSAFTTVGGESFAATPILPVPVSAGAINLELHFQALAFDPLTIAHDTNVSTTTLRANEWTSSCPGL